MKPESSKLPLPPQVEAWLSEQSDSDRRALEDTWRLAERGRPAMSTSDHRRKHEVWATVSGKARRSGRGEMPRPRLRRVTSKSWRWVAAAAVIAVLIGVGYMLRPVTVHAPHGEIAEATLPDGSRVNLNSGSTLTYRAHFLGTRSVFLEGEAFFDIVEDDDAFVVETANARTTVLGTEFNVRSRSDDGEPVTTVVVASGRVQLSSLGDSSESVILNPEERSAVKSAGVPTIPSRVLVDRELAWRHGGMAFNAESYSVIFAEIERRFAVEIDAPLDFRTDEYTYYVQRPSSPEAVLSDLAQANGFRYRETAHGFEVYRP